MFVTRKHLYKTIQEYLPDSVIEDESLLVFLLRREYLLVCSILHRIDIVYIYCNQKVRVFMILLQM